MPKLNLFLTWMDPYLYLWALLFASGLFMLVYSIRKYLELANSDFSEEEEDAAAGASPQAGPAPEFAEAAVTGAGQEAGPIFSGGLMASEVAAALVAEAAVFEQPGAGPEAAAEAAASPAENFVRGIYVGISGLDARLKDIEVSLLKGRSNNDYAVKFLEDITADIDSLDKAKIKARLEYLLSDLKK